MVVQQSYLVLAGGLGSSKYIQDEMVKRYEGDERNFTVHVVEDPEP